MTRKNQAIRGGVPLSSLPTLYGVGAKAHDLIVDCQLTQAVGIGERDAAKDMAAAIPGAHQKTICVVKNYETKVIVAEMRRLGVTPHMPQNTNRPGGTTIDGRTTLHEGYAKSINSRQGIEKVFGWIKQWGGLRQFKPHGTGKVSAKSILSMTIYYILWLGNLLSLAMASV